MFSTAITSTPYTSVDGETMFSDKINACFMMNDVTLTATMRALVAPRMPDDAKLTAMYIEEGFGGFTDWLRLDWCESKEMFLLVNIRKGGDDYKTVFDDITDYMCNMVGYKELQTIEGFFAKSMPIRCLVNEELRSTIVLVQRLSLKKLHLLQSTLLAMVPWYHGDRSSVSTDEFELIESLTEDTSNAYMRCIEKLASKLDFRGARIRRLLSGYETIADKNRQRDTEEQIRSVNNNIASYQTSLARCLQQKNELLITLMGLNTKIAEYNGRESDFMSYILRNKRIDVYDARDGWVEFTASVYFEFFDEDMVERVISNEYSDLYTKASSFEEACDMAELMRKVFLDKELKIKTIAAYRMTAGYGVEALGGYSYHSPDNVNCIPNPHIHYFSCLGNYIRPLNDLMADNDYIGAIDQCLASARSINWAESPTMKHFFQDLYEDCYDCVELPNGDMVSPSQAIEWIKKEKEAAEKADELKAICFEEDELEDEEDEEE